MSCPLMEKNIITLSLKNKKGDNKMIYYSLIGFMYRKDAPKEFINHTAKKGESILLLSKKDLCLSLIDIMDFIKG